MLTSSANQYLRPEYLTPLPTTLDAKKSPLALLAQTCSQIGADPPTGKSLLGTLESGKGGSGSGKGGSKSSSDQQSRDKSSPASSSSSSSSGGVSQVGQSESISRSSFKPYESCLGREKASTPEEQQRAASSHSASGRSRTPGSKRCSSNQSASSARAVTPQGRRTVTPNGEATRESPASRSFQAEVSAVSQAQGSPMSVKSAYSTAGVMAMVDSSMKDLPLGTYKPASTLPVSTSAAYLGYPHQMPIDVMASSLMSQHHAALKNGLASNPYLSYARMKTGSGVDTLVPICRDPFCTGCQLNPHFLATSNGKVPTSTANSCPAGCAQCDHKPAASPYGPLSAHTAAAYAHAQLAALAAASQLPYVCNWIAGDTAYCGKRFSSSEELLQHLRSHTSVSAGDPAATAAALSLLSPPGLPPGHPLLARTYPTPPLSPLATGRYHPYGKPSNLMQPSLSSLGLALPPHHPAAGLPPYFSPYSLYGGPRLGAASGMHP